MSRTRTQDILRRIKNSVSERITLEQSLDAAKKVYSKRMRAHALFRAIPYQEEFLFTNATEVLVRGGTRSGKSTIIAAALSAYVLNETVATSTGLRIPMREPHYADKAEGEVWIIGKQMNHSSTIYRLLCESGAFQIVRDKKTGAWRAWQPGVIPGDDEIPETERKSSPPFIYPSEVEIGWEKRREKQWNTMKLPNGWTIKYFPSNGQPKRGDPVHRIWFDEDIENDIDLYAECQSRLSDFGGRIWWSSWPDLRCPALVELYERCVADMHDWRAGLIPKPDFYEMGFIGSANPVIKEEEKRKRRKGWDQATALARDLGEFNRSTVLSYPEFNKHYHAADYGPDDPRNDKLAKVLRANNYVPPSNWCVYLILDPGTNRPALLWVAIPPEEYWYRGVPFYVPYRELVGPFNARQLAFRAKQIEPNRVYQRFVMDCKAGDQTPMGDFERVMDKYSNAFREQALLSVETQDRFQRGEHVWVIRAMALKQMMMPAGDDAQVPQLRIVTHACPNLVTEIQKNMKHVAKHEVQDKQAPGQVKDLLDCMEYFAGCHPEYRTPPPQSPPETPGYRAWKMEEQRWQSVTHIPVSPNANVTVCGVP